uniref:R3H domain-containing protein n=3 Tax=Palpitomonas bilix TaxID=652834 RepID=A0A7S3GBB9_9EUKA|mmetsp:Transcript_42910/g.110762  ORF Transcript_42910/g.110762 Transcript_42910/m.110762 type:complete len:239 (+) Transcript_42910:152-868(+)
MMPTTSTSTAAKHEEYDCHRLFRRIDRRVRCEYAHVRAKQREERGEQRGERREERGKRKEDRGERREERKEDWAGCKEGSEEWQLWCSFCAHPLFYALPLLFFRTTIVLFPLSLCLLPPPHPPPPLLAALLRKGVAREFMIGLEREITAVLDTDASRTDLVFKFDNSFQRLLCHCLCKYYQIHSQSLQIPAGRVTVVRLRKLVPHPDGGEGELRAMYVAPPLSLEQYIEEEMDGYASE